MAKILDDVKLKETKLNYDELSLPLKLENIKFKCENLYKEKKHDSDYIVSRIDEIDLKIDEAHVICESLKCRLNSMNHLTYLKKYLDKIREDKKGFNALLDVLAMTKIFETKCSDLNENEIFVATEKLISYKKNIIYIYNTPQLADKVSNIIDNIFVYLKEFFQNNLELIIKETGFPFTRNNLFLSFENRDDLKKKLSIFINLLEFKDAITSSIQQPNYSTIIDLVNLFIKPIKTRYVYHFHGSKETSSLSKPEWGFKKLLSWLELNLPLIIDHFLPLIDDYFIKSSIENAFAHSFPDLIYHVLIERIEKYFVNESIFLHLVDELFIFEQKFCFIVNSKKPPFLHYSLSIINPELNRKLYDKWRHLQSDHILSNITKCAESSDLFKQRFSDTPHLNKFRYPEMSYIAITSITLLINKAKSSTDECLKLNLLRFINTISNEIIQIFVIQLPVSFLFSSKTLCHILIFLNAIHHIYNYLSIVLNEKWFLNGFPEHDQLLLRREFDLSSKNAIEIIDKKIDQVIESYIEYLDKLTENIPSFQYDSSENINKFSSLLLGIKKIVVDYIDVYLCNELALKILSRLNCKIDCFLKRYIFMCNLNHDIYKEEVQNIYIACIIDTFEIYFKNDQICPITTKEIYKNL